MQPSSYPALETKDAIAYLSAIRSSEDISLEKLLKFRLCDTPYSESALPDLINRLKSLMAQYPAELSIRSQEGGRFERDASEIVHKFFSAFPLEALEDNDFWRYITVVHFRWLVEWRHGGASRPARLANYGIEGDRRNLLLRMYYRAAVSIDLDKPSDPYHLSRLGDEDLWKSHFGAVKIGNCPEIVKAIITVSLKGEPEFSLSTKQVRELSKNLTRLRSNVILEIYDSASATNLVKNEIRKLKSTAK
jgi:hypothetical protein